MNISLLRFRNICYSIKTGLGSYIQELTPA